jgi:hypothetical protein
MSEELKIKIEAAHKELSALCHGKQFRMCIPVQPDDTDRVIGEGLRAGMKALDEIERLLEDKHQRYLVFEKQRAKIGQLETRIAELEADAERLATALKDLQMAVAYDLRHSDNEDEDKAWDALNKLSDSLSQGSTALAAHDAAKDGPK